MKIYLFDPETGIYQGEDFADERSMCHLAETVPPYATNIAPPRFRRGEVPIFARTRNEWELRTSLTVTAGTDSASAEHTPMFAEHAWQPGHEEE